jgi:DNA-directed RNA polymerase subunit E'/Rpb7
LDDREGGGFAVFQKMACRWMSAQASIRARILGCSSKRNRRQTIGITASIMMEVLSAARGEGRIQLRNSYE